MTKKKTDVVGVSSFEPGLLSIGEAGATQAVSRAGERSAELVEAWVNAKNAVAVAAVAGDESAPAPARKAARRGLNVLKSRGIAVPIRQHIARVGGADVIEGYEAWFMPPDPSGSGVFFLGSRRASGKLQLIQLTFRDAVGLGEIRALEASRSRLREMFSDIASRVGFEPTPVPIDWARSKIAAIKAISEKSGAILPLGLDTHAGLLGPVPEIEPPHPIDAAHLELPAGSAGIKASGQLHDIQPFVGWLPSGEAVQELIQAIGQALGGAANGPERDQSKIDVVLGAAIDAATDRFFSPEIRERIASIMKDVAISILASEGRDRAALVMATAAATISAGLITSPPHEVPFLRAFFQKALAMVAAQSGGQLSVPVPTIEAGEGIAPASPSEPATETAQPGETL